MKQKRLFLVLLSALAAGNFAVPVAMAEEAPQTVQKDESQPMQSSSSAVPNPQSVIQTPYDATGIPIAPKRAAYPFARTGGIEFYAGLTSYFGYDDNVTLANPGSARSSDYLSLRPQVSAQSRYGGDSYALTYQGDLRRYPAFDANGTNAHNLSLNVLNIFTTRASLTWAASYADVEDPLGSTDRSTSGNTPDHHRDLSLTGTFGYGAQDARGRVEVDVGVGSKRFLNNHATTEGSDVDNTGIAGRFLYRIAPKTQLLTEVSRAHYDYQHDTSLMTNTDYRYYLGAKWEATAATTGTIKFGEQSKKFESSARDDFNGFAWEASIRWQPLTYSTFDLVAGRAATDSSGANVDYVQTQRNSLNWRHDWKDYLHSNASVGFQRSRYIGSSRNDRQNSYVVGLTYDMRRWLGIGVQYEYTRRASTDDTYDYLRHLTMVRLDATF